MGKTKEQVFPSIDELSATAAKDIAAWIQETTGQGNLFSIALAGGSTPKKLYSILAKSYKDEINWEKVHFFFGDERLVAPADDASNFKLAHDSLLSKVRIPSGNIHAVPTELGDGPTIAQRYEEEIKHFFGGTQIPVFDLILLGLGSSDGHTASLFPDKPSLSVADRLVVDTTPGVLPPPINRVTFTFPLINAAKHVVFLVSGKDKRDALIAAQSGTLLPDGTVAPANNVRPMNGELDWYVDELAKGTRD